MADIKKLQNGSDIRGIACEGVEGTWIQKFGRHRPRLKP